MIKRWIIMLVAVPAVAALGMILPGMKSREPGPVVVPSEDDGLPWVSVVEIERSATAIPVVATGILNRRMESVLAFHKSGMLAEVMVRPGDMVRRGQVLARLRLDEIDAGLAKAKVQVEKFRRDVSRLTQLHEQRAVSLEALQNAQSGLELAEAELKIAGFARRHGEILAPDDGAILGRHAEPEEWVEEGRPVVAFGSSNAGWIVKASVAGQDAQRLQVGDMAESAGITGKIGHIAEAVDPVTRTVAVEVICDAPPPGARSHQVVEMMIRPRPVEARPCVPASALIAGDGGFCRVFLWDQETDKVHGVRVKVAAFLEGTAYLSPELPVERDWVVTAGAEFLRDGMKVRRALPQ